MRGDHFILFIITKESVPNVVFRLERIVFQTGVVTELRRVRFKTTGTSSGIRDYSQQSGNVSF